MATRKAIRPAGVFTSPYFSPAIQAGQFLFLSGCAAIDEERKVVSEDCTEQAEYIMQVIKKILEAAGASLDDVVKTTTYLTNPADYAAYNAVRARYFPEDPPASTTFVTALLRPELLIEVDAVALIPDKG